MARKCMFLQKGAPCSSCMSEAEGRVLYLHCYPWDLEHRWGPGVQRGLGHQGSQEHQQYREHPAGVRTDILAQGWRAWGRWLMGGRGVLETYVGTFSARLSISTRVSLSHRERRVSDSLEL